jgi:hypothetical protein
VRKARVAIEIDGGVHDFPGRPEYDAKRQAHLESLGWRFVRIRTEATHDPMQIIDAVLSALPLPLRGGGGGRGEAPAAEVSLPASSTTRGGASPHPPTPSPRGGGEFEPRLQRRTRANRKLKPRSKKASSATEQSATPSPKIGFLGEGVGGRGETPISSLDGEGES